MLPTETGSPYCPPCSDLYTFKLKHLPQFMQLLGQIVKIPFSEITGFGMTMSGPFYLLIILLTTLLLRNVEKQIVFGCVIFAIPLCHVIYSMNM